MKIIDLLNKIANGEEVPKRIYYKGDIWYLEQDFSNRLPYYKNGYNMDNLLSGEEKDYFSHALNDEVVVEEEKKIPEKLDVISWDKCIHGVTHKEKELAIQINKTQELLNQLIDYLKSKGDE